MLWVAEVGSAHKGVPSLAYEYIRAYSDAGANVLKFQFGWTKEAQEAQGLEYKPERYVDGMAFDLKKWCDYFGVKMMASIWSQEGLKVAEAVDIDYYKVPFKLHGSQFSDSLENKIRIYAAYHEKECYVSGLNIFCISEYPTYPERLRLPERFGFLSSGGFEGYSDHTHGIEACLLAVSRGARYIEKHVALDKTDLITKDTPFSASPAEFEEMVRLGNGIRRLLDASV